MTMEKRKIKTALLSVYDKTGLDQIAHLLHQHDVQLFSTGGTYRYIEQNGLPVQTVESLTTYPSILGGRVKTLHPKVFGGILAKREEGHLSELMQYDIPQFDLVIVDLYPFEQTIRETDDEDEIIEKIDIGGISLIRAAAKNFHDVLVVSSKNDYGNLLELISEKSGYTHMSDRKTFARKAFRTSAHYDSVIFNYFNSGLEEVTFKQSYEKHRVLRYGENPHQNATFFGPLREMLEQIQGKELSYNNLVDIDAAIELMFDFKDDKPTFAILKHTNACGVAQRETIEQAWIDALACDNISAFGGILIANCEIDLVTAERINEIFFEVLIAPSFSDETKALFSKKKKRVLLQLNHYKQEQVQYKSLLNGVVQQNRDLKLQPSGQYQIATKKQPTSEELEQMRFGVICAKHLKSNTIALVKNNQLVGMGCGQTSRVDALKQAITKAKAFGFDLQGAVMASDAFFPFPDCVEIAEQEGILAVVQPGGSIRDQDSIDYCDQHNMTMALTGLRHFKH